MIALKNVLVYGDTKLNTVGMDYTKVKAKKQVLFLMAGAIQSYSEAVLKLLDPPVVYDKAAEVIFRSMMETIINLNYIYSEKTQIKALCFMIYSSEEKIDFAKKHQKFMLKRPQWQLAFGPNLKPADWDEFIDNENKTMVLAEKHFKKKLVNKFQRNLAKRAKEADVYLEKKGKLKQGNSLEHQYFLYYKHFSQLAHLTMPGLEQFINKKDNSKWTYVIDGNGDDLERVCFVTFGLYLDFLRFFLKEYGIYNKEEWGNHLKELKRISRTTSEI